MIQSQNDEINKDKGDGVHTDDDGWTILGDGCLIKNQIYVKHVNKTEIHSAFKIDK